MAGLPFETPPRGFFHQLSLLNQELDFNESSRENFDSNPCLVYILSQIKDFTQEIAEKCLERYLPTLTNQKIVKYLVESIKKTNILSNNFSKITNIRYNIMIDSDNTPFIYLFLELKDESPLFLRLTLLQFKKFLYSTKQAEKTFNK